MGAAGFPVPAGALLAVMGAATDANDAALGFVQLTSIDTFTANGQPVNHDRKARPENLPRGVTLRKLDTALDFTLSVALPAPGSAPADALLAAPDRLVEASGPRQIFPVADQDADLRLAVLEDSARPDAIWILPSTGLAEDLGSTSSVSTADKDGAELAATLADTLTSMARAHNLLKLGAVVGAGTIDVEVELLSRTPEDRSLRPLPFSPLPSLHPLARG